MIDLKTKCLNAAGLTKPNKADFMKTVDGLLLMASANYDNFASNEFLGEEEIHKLIGQVLRLYQQWPRSDVYNDDMSWLLQALSNNPKRAYLCRAYRLAEWLITSDGYRYHMTRSTVGYNWPEPTFCVPIFPTSELLKLLQLSDFRNVETDLVFWNGHTYEEKYVLQAFAGSRVMLTPDSSESMLNLKTEDGNRVAIIAPLRT